MPDVPAPDFIVVRGTGTPMDGKWYDRSAWIERLVYGARDEDREHMPPGGVRLRFRPTHELERNDDGAVAQVWTLVSTASKEPGLAPTLTTERDDDGNVTAIVALTPFPDVLEVTRELMERSELWPESDQGLEVLDNGMLDFRLANGRWVYEIVEWVRDERVAICEIRYREDPDEWPGEDGAP